LESGADGKRAAQAKIVLSINGGLSASTCTGYPSENCPPELNLFS